MPTDTRERSLPATTTIEPSVLYFGTPVVVLSTLNADGTTNLSPISSTWALGNTYVLGLHHFAHGADNVRRHRDVVINMASPSVWELVERLAPLTGADPVPEAKREKFRTSHDKFADARLTAVPAETVAAQRVGELPVQIEATVERVDDGLHQGFVIVQTEVRRIHIDERMVIPGTQHVDLTRWQPLLYNFRHCFGRAEDLGRTFRAEY